MTMMWVELVTVLAVLQCLVFSFLSGGAREKYKVEAPATSGNEVYERRNRVHQNTIEQLMVWLPSLWIAAQYTNPNRIAAIGAVFLVGRALYYTGYVKDPKKRGLGFGISFLSTAALLIYALVDVIRALLHG
jgi:glutathione S-transferase